VLKPNALSADMRYEGWAVKKNRANKVASPKTLAEGVEKPKKTPKKRAPSCEAKGCRKPGISQGYCRLHYFSHWREIKENEKVKAERRLNAYVDRLAKRYPDDYLEKIKEGIEDEDAFKKTMEQLALDPVQEEESETEREYLEKLVRTNKIDE
jgi:hypothetical protein